MYLVVGINANFRIISGFTILLFTLFYSVSFSQNEFISVWQSDNPGPSLDNQITIPTSGAGYNYNIYWEDVNNAAVNGNLLNNTGTVTITFPIEGTYRIEIDGDFPRIAFNNGGDRMKIISVEQWGNIQWTSFSVAFYGCENLQINAVDAPDLSMVGSFYRAFRGASTLNSDLSNWNTVNVTSMQEAFFQATNFNQSLGAWNVSNVTNMGNMLSFSGMNQSSYDATITAWQLQSVQNNVTLGATNVAYCNAVAERQQLITTNNWNFAGDIELCEFTIPFISVWQSDNPGSSANNQITIPTTGVGYNYNVYWEDVNNVSQNGNLNNITGSTTITFPAPGTYRIEITGSFPRIFFSGGGDRRKIIAIEQWGDGQFLSMASAFHGCNNLEINAVDAPDLSLVTSLYRIFRDNSSLDTDLSNWNTSGVTDMREVFLNCTSFNQSLSSWDVSAVTLMNSMLSNSNISQTNYDATLIAWEGQAVQSNVTLNATGRLYCTSEVQRQNLITNNNWTITGDELLCPFNQAFTTIWQSDNPGSSGNNQISIPTTGGNYFYNVYWEDVNDATINGNLDNLNGNTTISFPAPGTYRVEITGSFPRIFFNGGGDRRKIISIEQWGDGQFNSMSSAFHGCENLEINAIDAPNLNFTSSLYRIFRDNNNLNTDLSNWSTSGITDMREAFFNCSNFNQSLAAWDISNVTLMNNMLSNSNLNQANYDATLISWEGQAVQNNVTLNATGRRYCSSLSQRQNLITNSNWTITGDELLCPFTNPFISIWKTDNPGTSLNNQITIPTAGGDYLYDIYWEAANNPSVFGAVNDISGNYTITFPTPGNYRVEISGFFPRIHFNNGGDRRKILSVEQWGDGNWFSMSGAFFGAENLVINAIDAPVLSSATSMYRVFRNANLVNQDISHWNVGNITSMQEAFYFTSSFNQDISAWDVSNVSNMINMFNGASFFNQDLGNWNIGNVTNMTNIFNNTAMSVANYDATLIGWQAQAVQNNVNVGASGAFYCNSESERLDLITNSLWNFSGDNLNCPASVPFISIWQSDIPGQTASNQILIPTTGTGYNYNIYWEDVNNAANNGTINNLIGDYTITFPGPGTYRVEILGNFPRIYFNNYGDRNKLLSIEQWGDNVWFSMNGAFYGASNMVVNAIDNPDLSMCTDFYRIFRGTSSFNQDISAWDVSNVTTMQEAFTDAISFNQDISSWDVSNVQNFANTFRRATTFNQAIGAWNTSAATNMAEMLRDASNFNQSIAGFDLSNVTNLGNMLTNCGMNVPNYDATLTAWSLQAVQNNVNLGASGLFYCNSLTERQNLINNNNWNIIGDNELCSSTLPFITVWQTDNPGVSGNNQVTIPTTGGGYFYEIYWEDVNNAAINGTSSANTGNTTITFPSPGTYRLEISGYFPRIFFNAGGDRQKILSVEQWGDGVWLSMNSAFYNASNLVVNATDAPNLSYADNMYRIFRGASSLNQDISNWNVSTITNMEQAFYDATAFNQDISTWDVSNVENFRYMFRSATTFNQPIGSWNTSAALDMLEMFRFATNFNQSLAGFNVSNVNNMFRMLDNTSIDRDNYDATLISWESQAVQNNVSLGANTLVYCASENARQNLINNNNWSIQDDALDCPPPFISIWQSNNPGTSNNNQITIPGNGGGYDFDIYWEDENNAAVNGSISGLTGTTTITFPAPGTYRLEISGDFPRIYFNNTGDRQKILSVEQWGVQQWTSMNNAFYGAENLIINALDTPDFSIMTDMSGMFRGANSLNQNISFWDVSTITNMASLFQDAGIFNQNIGAWNTSNVTNMANMFNNAGNFNQSLGGWNISSVSNMTGMLDNTSLNVANYDGTLFSWGNQNVQNGVVLDANGLNYCNAQTERQSLITNDSWTINNDALNCPFVQAFITVWQTDNPGTTNNDQIRIPTTGAGYNYDIYWEDVNDNNINGVLNNQTGDAIITFPATGTYRVEITGIFPRIYFNNSFDRRKIISIEQWGNGGWSSMVNAFFGAENLTSSAADMPDLSAITNMTQMFRNASSFNANIAAWDVSNVTSMLGVFQGASSFNQNIASWDISSVADLRNAFNGATAYNHSLAGWNISNVTLMNGMLNNSGLSQANYDATLIGWESQAVQPNVNLGATNLFYCNALAQRQSLITNDSWVISGDNELCAFTNAFITTWRTDNPGTSNVDQITIPTIGIGYDYNIYWEDVNDATINGIENGLTGTHTITFPAVGTYRIEITGMFPRIYFNNGGDRRKILSIEQWGDGGWSSMDRAFSSANNLIVNAVDAPNLSAATSLFRMFLNCNSMNTDISHWDVSNITDMREVFYNATSFNQDISAWDVSNVTNFTRMFRNANAFNQSMAAWNTSSAQNMLEMFRDANSFNQSLANFNISNVTNMIDMLRNCNISPTNYDATLISWSAQAVQPNVSLGALNAYYCNAGPQRQSLITNNGWVITGDDNLCPFNQAFISTWRTDNPGTSANNEITIPTTGLGYNYDIYWEEVGNPANNGTETGITGSYTITFPSIGTYRIEITGLFSRIFFNNGGDRRKILSVEQWGDGGFTSMSAAFFGTENLVINATDNPNLSACQSLFRVFRNANSINSDFSAWNVSSITDMQEAFMGASSYNQDISLWDVSNVGSFQNMFRDANSFNQAIGAWNTSSASNMANMFLNAVSFNQSLANWNIQGVTNMSGMLNNTGISTANYDATLTAWEAQAVQNNVSLGASGLYFCNSTAERQNLINNSNWNITGDNEGCPANTAFISIWQSDNPGSSANDQIIIPTTGVGYLYDIYWEDINDAAINGTILALTGNQTINFPAPGTYRLEITGLFPRIYFNNQGDRRKIISVEQWGDNPWTSMNSAFYGAENLVINAADNPDLNNLNDMSRIFMDALSVNQDISTWNTAQVTNLQEAFRGAANFNQDISAWNVANVNNMQDMFSGALNFNQSLASWNIGNVTNMIGMLDNCGMTFANYDATIIAWEAQAVQPNITLGAANLIFCNAENQRQDLINNENWNFNGDALVCPNTQAFITTWQSDNPGVTANNQIRIPAVGGSFQYDIYWEDANNAAINGSENNISGVHTITFPAPGTYRVEISGVFPRIFFNNSGDRRKIIEVNQWGDGAWTSMNGAFYGAENLNILDNNPPNLSAVNNMFRMFRGANSLNADISNWDVSNVINMQETFRDAILFNQDLSTWNTSNVNTMREIFRGAISLDFPVGDWDITQTNDIIGMLNGSGFSCGTYSNALFNWSNLANTPTNLSLGAQGLQYSTAATPYRDTLINVYNWNITDAGNNPNCNTPLPVSLIDFRAFKWDNNTVKLEWSTQSELNNEVFIVERSFDAQHWNEIYRTAGKAYSNTRTLYETFDYTPIQGNNYYRLKQIDFDGAFEYFDIQHVFFKVDEDIEISIYPNPTRDRINIRSNQKKLKITIYNLHGKTMYTSTNQYEIDLSQLVNGAYFIKIENEQATIYNGKLIKQ